ncbi:hypothetical protein [Alicyclobacillus sp. SO9]|uniref:hypothetical protein n=1 Tax=Alicyclobacillus sp. SO9 TaxID=2665646 RepID=UPI0018E76BD5|nr:hypothetical protein [Alicyclobacillus sp. SO9]QQE80894.1 hypothetical protein GI364_11215 [Alicyclobacillus sp. SO9]
MAKIVGLIVPSIGTAYLLEGELPTSEFHHEGLHIVTAIEIKNQSTEYEDGIDNSFTVVGTGIEREINNVPVIVFYEKEAKSDV